MIAEISVIPIGAGIDLRKDKKVKMLEHQGTSRGKCTGKKIKEMINLLATENTGNAEKNKYIHKSCNF